MSYASEKINGVWKKNDLFTYQPKSPYQMEFSGMEQNGSYHLANCNGKYQPFWEENIMEFKTIVLLQYSILIYYIKGESYNNITKAKSFKFKW